MERLRVCDSVTKKDPTLLPESLSSSVKHGKTFCQIKSKKN